MSSCRELSQPLAATATSLDFINKMRQRPIAIHSKPFGTTRLPIVLGSFASACCRRDCGSICLNCYCSVSTCPEDLDAG